MQEDTVIYIYRKSVVFSNILNTSNKRVAPKKLMKLQSTAVRSKKRRHHLKKWLRSNTQ